MEERRGEVTAQERCWPDTCRRCHVMAVSKVLLTCFSQDFLHRAEGASSLRVGSLITFVSVTSRSHCHGTLHWSIQLQTLPQPPLACGRRFLGTPKNTDVAVTNVREAGCTQKLPWRAHAPLHRWSSRSAETSPGCVAGSAGWVKEAYERCLEEHNSQEDTSSLSRMVV